MGKVERTEVVINGSIHLMTDEQIGDLVVDITPAQLEALMLEVAREKGEPEPILYDDKTNPINDNVDGEKVLNEIIEVQERMAKGMLLIEECNKVIEEAKQGKRLPKPVFMQWVNRRGKLWSHWWNLKANCEKLASECPSVWNSYFKLIEEPFQPYFTYGKKEDELEGVDSRHMSAIDAYAVSHIEENK